MKIIRLGDEILSEDSVPLISASFPEAYKLVKSGVRVLGRVSEFEPTCRLFHYHLIDPLTSWGVHKYEYLIDITDPNHELYIMMPSTHGHALVTDINVAKMCAKYPQVKGLITRYPDEVGDALSQ